MAKKKPTFTPEPRNWNEHQVAARFNRGQEWFRLNRTRLEKAGFPKKDDLLGGWDADAIDRWWDERSGLLEPANDGEARLLEQIHARAG